MKILMINVVSGIKSTGRICTDLASELMSEGHEVKIIYGREEAPKPFDKISYKLSNKLETAIHVLQSRVYDGSGFGSFFSTKNIISFIDDFDPDIIHLHNLHGYYINIKLLFNYFKKNNKKIIWTLHDMWALTGHTPYCDTIDCDKWLEGCFNCPLKNEYPKTFFDNSTKNWIKKKNLFKYIPNLLIVTPSEWLHDQVKKSYLSDYRTLVINNGIDTNLFRHTKSDFKDIHKIKDKTVLLGVATAWDKNKGLNDFYELSRILGEEYKIVLVGLSEEQLNNVPQNIIGIKKTNSIDELVRIYSESDYLLNLSYCENYPTINIEAMACGASVLTYNTGGSPEIVQKYGGIIVEKGDIMDVKNKLEFYKDNKPKLTFNKTENDKKNMISKYIELYNELVD